MKEILQISFNFFTFFKKSFDNRENGWYYKRAVGEFNRTIFENWIRKKPRKRQFRIKKRKMSENI